MRGASDTGIEGTHHAPDRSFQLHIDVVGGDVALRGDPQRAFNGEHIVHGGNNELPYRNIPILIT